MYGLIGLDKTVCGKQSQNIFLKIFRVAELRILWNLFICCIVQSCNVPDLIIIRCFFAYCYLESKVFCFVCMQGRDHSCHRILTTDGDQFRITTALVCGIAFCKYISTAIHVLGQLRDLILDQDIVEVCAACVTDTDRVRDRIFFLHQHTAVWIGRFPHCKIACCPDPRCVLRQFRICIICFCHCCVRDSFISQLLITEIHVISNHEHTFVVQIASGHDIDLFVTVAV